jgi:regulator of sirC expression with transglutaminase-like and TPR domain
MPESHAIPTSSSEDRTPAECALRAAARRRFAILASRPDGQVDLAEGALWISAEDNPGLDVAAAMGRLDVLAAELAPRLQALAPGPGADLVRLDALRAFLFEEKGFRGDCEEFYDPANSYLDRVLERRRGIPLTLAVVMMEVGRRVGVPLLGVGFPGHFLVRHARHLELLIDPFAGGRLVSPEDCRTILAGVCGSLPFHPRLLRPVTHRCMLQRLLNNLRAIHQARGDVGAILSVLDRLLLLAPDDAVRLRERGMLRLRLGDMAGLEDLVHYLDIEPEAPDRESLAGLLATARGRYATIH